MPGEEDTQKSTFGRVLRNNVILENGVVPPDEPECFRNHPRYTNISVSTLGNFKRKGKDVKVFVKGAQRLTVDDESGEKRILNKNILIAEAFLGPRPSNHYRVGHLDQDQTNFRLSNLWWVPMDAKRVLPLKLMTDDELVHWTPCPCPYEKYFYSSTGQVRSGDMLLKTCINNGYWRIHIYDNTGARSKFVTLHAFIAYCAYGPRPNGYDVAHLNDNPLDCSPSNLGQAMRKFEKPVVATSIDGDKIPFTGVTAASVHFGLPQRNMKSKLTRGTLFKFEGKTWILEGNGEPITTHGARVRAPANSQEWTSTQSPELQGLEVLPDGRIRKVGHDFLITACGNWTYKVIRYNGKTIPVHLIVLDAYSGPRPSRKHCGDHLDENKSHNCQSNLAWTLKNSERSIGRACERFVDGRWEQFMSLRAAADQILHEDNSGRNPETVTRNIACAVNGTAKTSCGYVWRPMIRTPDTRYTCTDCNMQFERRGDWVSPDTISK